jgi:hypothetical protein
LTEAIGGMLKDATKLEVFLTFVNRQNFTVSIASNGHHPVRMSLQQVASLVWQRSRQGITKDDEYVRRIE